MAPLDSRLRTVGGSSASSRPEGGKLEEISPQLKLKADEITDELLSRLRPHIYEAALFALERQRDESSAKIWLERRIFRPAQQLFEQAIRVKKASIPAPSRRPTPSDSGATDVTGTWRKGSSPGSKKPASAAPPPPTLDKDDRDDAALALKRVLAQPDRATVTSPAPRSSRRPVPPPPGGSAKDAATPAAASSPAGAGLDLPPVRPNKSELELERGPTPSALPSPAPAEQEPVSAPSSSEIRASQVPSSQTLSSKLKALDYLDSPQDQATHLVDLLLEVAPSSCIMVHTVNPRTQEAVAVGAHGEHAAALSGWITEAEDPLLTQLRRTRRPVRILAPTRDERSQKGRWAVFSPKKYLAAVPVTHDHKLVGFFELADPLENGRFAQTQLDAIDTIAKAWAARLGKVD